MNLNSPIQSTKNEIKSEEFKDIAVIGDSRIDPLKTKAILERDNVNRKFKRVKRKPNIGLSN
jgi:hypothetical protein